MSDAEAQAQNTASTYWGPSKAEGSVVQVTCLTSERGQCAKLRLVSDRVASWEWESFDRRMPRARDRLGPLALWKPKRRPRRS
jgi:hypothetical protein